MGKLWAFKEFNMPTFSGHFEYIVSFQIFFQLLNFKSISVFQQICSFIHKENVLLKIIAGYLLVCLLF